MKLLSLSPGWRKFILSLTTVILVVLLGIILLSSQTAIPPSSGEVLRVKIAPGSNVAAIGRQLQNQGASVNSVSLQIVFRTLFIGKKLKAGVYDFPKEATLYQLIRQMAQGDTVRFQITLIEGWTFKQFRSLIESQKELKVTLKGQSAQRILAALGSPHQHPEGLFFPNTYTYEPGDTDFSIYTKAYRAMEKKLSEAWEKNQHPVHLKNPYELLILASIIEKETGSRAERAQISGVFHNRLKIGMMLQTDPTVIYGLGDQFDGNLRKKDLLRDGPYNTYRRRGLPPTPIAMPGMESLVAAAQPSATEALYFVADGQGRSVFSRTLAEHEAAVRKYQLKQ